MKKYSVCFVFLLTILMTCIVQTKLSAALIQAPNDSQTYYKEVAFIEVEGGDGHTISLTAEGDVYGSGANAVGQLGDGTTTERLILTNITAQFALASDDKIVKIFAGGFHSAALSNDGKLFMWGLNQYGQLGDGTTTKKTSPVDITEYFNLASEEVITNISLGYEHSLVSTNFGTVYSFGYNNHGQLGNNNTTSQLDPVDITSNFSLSSGEIIVDIEAGYFHSAALTSDNKLFTWGYNSFGQLGDGSSNDRYVPTNITSKFSFSSGESFDYISFGSQHSSALLSTGRVFTWGYNSHGECGNNSLSTVYSPTEITSEFDLVENETVKDIDIGAYHALATTSEQRYFTWGYNGFGQLGNSLTGLKAYPQDITDQINLPDDEYPISLGAGGYHSFFTTNNNTLIAWGRNQKGQLGNNTTENQLTPIVVGVDYAYIKDNHFSFTDPIIKTSLGVHNTHALTASGRVFSWGFNQYGQLGNNTKINQAAPIDITDNFLLVEDETILDVNTNYFHSMALTSNHRVFSWGKNSDYQLGDGSNDDKLIPQDITGQFEFNTREIVTDIETGYRLSAAVTSEGRLFMWGYYPHDDFDDDSSFYQETPYDMTSQFSLDSGEKIISVALGYYHYSVLTSENRVFVWGINNYGQIGDSSTTDRDLPTDITSNFALNSEENIIDLSLGDYHSGILTSDGRIFMWGYNNYGQIGNGSTNNQLSPVDISSQFSLNIDETITEFTLGKYHSGAISSNGQVFTWGYNAYYQLGDNSTSLRTIPKNITHHFNLFFGESLTKPNFGSRHSSIISEEGHIFIWGDNNYGQLGNETNNLETTPLAINAILSELNSILFTFSNEQENYLKPHMNIVIYPQYDFKDEIKQITVNNIVYDTNQFDVEDGQVTLEIPIDGNLGDELDFTVNNFILINDQTITLSSNNTTSTTLIEDSVPPTITYEYDYNLYVEQGIGHNQLLEASAIDDTLDEIDVIQTGIVEWNKPGAYKIYYSATDLSGNIQTHERIIIIMPEISIDNSIIHNMIFNNFVSEPYMDILDLTNQAITYNETTYYSNTDYSDFSYSVGWNSLAFAFEIEERYVLVSKNVYVEDTIAPTFDTILDQTIEIGSEDIDWITYIKNPQDNSNGILTKTKVEDNVDYDTLGTYTVTLKLSDESGNETIQTFNVTVEDSISPQVYLNSSLDTLEVGKNYTEYGVTATDSTDTSLEIIGTVDTTSPGTYKITYIVTDIADNETIIERYVTVYERNNDIVFVLGDAKTTINVGEDYIDGSCLVMVNGLEQDCVVKENTINNSIAGIYTITYAFTYEDKEYTYTRYIFVLEDNEPLLLYFATRKEEEIEL